MLDLNFEIISPLTTQERYDIIENALNAANDNGFLNQYIFEQSLWCQAAAILVDDVSDEIKELIEVNPMEAWDKMIKEEILQEFFNKYNDLGIKDEITGQTELYINYLGRIATEYFNDYKDFLLSLGGALSQTDMMSTENLDEFKQSLQDFISSDNTLKTLEVADSWGMNNKIEDEKPTQEQKEQIKDSLFN